MTKKSVFRKGMIIGIIILFVGAGVVPSIGGDIINLKKADKKGDRDQLDQEQTECGDSGQATIAGPWADFLIENSGRTFTFTCISEAGPGRSIQSRKWCFGDGTIGSGQKVDHTYPSYGDMWVRLIVVDNMDDFDSKVKSINVPKSYNSQSIPGSSDAVVNEEQSVSSYTTSISTNSQSSRSITNNIMLNTLIDFKICSSQTISQIIDSTGTEIGSLITDPWPCDLYFQMINHPSTGVENLRFTIGHIVKNDEYNYGDRDYNVSFVKILITCEEWDDWSVEFYPDFEPYRTNESWFIWPKGKTGTYNIKLTVIPQLEHKWNDEIPHNNIYEGTVIGKVKTDLSGSKGSPQESMVISSTSTSQSSSNGILFQFFQRFPNLFPIIRQILGQNY